MTPDRITELAKQAMVDTCDHFGEETPTQDRLDELHDDAETLWLLQRFAELVRSDALEEAMQVLEFHGFDDAVPYVKWAAANGRSKK